MFQMVGSYIPFLNLRKVDRRAVPFRVEITAASHHFSCFDKYPRKLTASAVQAIIPFKLLFRVRVSRPRADLYFSKNFLLITMGKCKMTLTRSESIKHLVVDNLAICPAITSGLPRPSSSQ